MKQLREKGEKTWTKYQDTRIAENQYRFHAGASTMEAIFSRKN